MNSDANWADAAQQMQKTFTAGLQQAMGGFGGAGPASGMGAGMGTARGFPPGGLPAINFDAAQLQQIQQRYLADAAALWNQGMQAGVAIPEALSAASDRRFSNQAWADSPVAKFAAANYLLNARTLMSMAEAVEGDAKTKARVRFAVEQAVAASAPSNFMAMNAEAIHKAIATQGQSIGKGIENMLHDLRQGHVSMTDESLFEVGKNVATTEGAVVFENEFFQLLEYKPLTAKVHERPILQVPPCINKFYILDLQPENSLIRYAVSQGQRTFVVSWRNPDESMATKKWDDYIEHAVIKAIAVVQEITGAKTINTLGFCVGGTMLATALAVLAANGEKPAASVTLLTSLLDFTDTGILDIFIDETSVKYREQEMGQGGLLKGQDLASTFSFLRPNDLVWNYVVEEDFDEFEEDDEDGSKALTKKLEELKKEALTRIDKIASLFEKVHKTYDKEGYGSPLYTKRQKALSDELMTVRFTAKTIEKLCDLLRGQMLDVRKKERELRRIIVEKCGMPQEIFIKDFPPNLLNLKWVEKQVASAKPWSFIMARNIPPIQELQTKLGELQARVVVPLGQLKDINKRMNEGETWWI